MKNPYPPVLTERNGKLQGGFKPISTNKLTKVKGGKGTNMLPLCVNMASCTPTNGSLCTNKGRCTTY